MGTSGGLQDNAPIGSFVSANYAIGFDGVLHFYADRDKVCDKAFEAEMERQLEWKNRWSEALCGQSSSGDDDQFVSPGGVVPGATIACKWFSMRHRDVACVVS